MISLVYNCDWLRAEICKKNYGAAGIQDKTYLEGGEDYLDIEWYLGLQSTIRSILYTHLSHSNSVKAAQ